MDNEETLPALNMLLSHLKNYNGPLNVECISGVIIEVHLRLGDVRFFPDKWEWDGTPLYLVPVWRTVFEENVLDKTNEDVIKQQDGVLDVIVDDPNMSAPACGLIRVCLVITQKLPQFENIDNECIPFCVACS